MSTVPNPRNGMRRVSAGLAVAFALLLAPAGWADDDPSTLR